MKGNKTQNKTELSVKQKKQLSKEARVFKVTDFYGVDEVFARSCEVHAFIGKFKEQYC